MLAGVAVTVDPVVELNPVEGNQLYVLAPLAVNVAKPPAQILLSLALTITFGKGLIVTTTLFKVVVFPFSVTIHVYVAEVLTKRESLLGPKLLPSFFH